MTVPAAVTIAVVGAPALAQELGKKGTVSDLTLYHEVHDARAVTAVEPTAFPEKLAPLFQALAMADHALVVVGELSRAVAETIAVVETTELPVTVARGPSVGEEELARALRGSRLASARPVPTDGPSLRAALAEVTAPAVAGPVDVPIDHAFPVKGVGPVALGVVRRGTVRAHDRLVLYPTGREVEVRSIQVHDVDRKEAACGERVGIALRGVEAEELGRGQRLAPPGALSVAPELSGGALARCRYYKGDAGAGAAVHLTVGLQVVPARLGELSDRGVTLAADRPLVYAPGEPAFVLDLGVPAGPRLVGRTTLSAPPAAR